MNDPFLIKLILSFIVGGLWIMLVSVLIEKLGTKIGGIIGGLPSIAWVSLFFIGLTQGTKAASMATTRVPLMVGVSSLFLILLMKLIEKKYLYAMTLGLFFWSSVALVITLLNFNSFEISVVVWILLISICYYLVTRKFTIKSRGKIHITYSFKQILGRAFFAGSLVAFAVLLSRIGGPVFGGIFASFPALYISTFSIAYHTHGIDFTRSLAKSLVVSGMTTTAIYVIVVHYLYLVFDLYSATVIAYFISIVSAFFVYLFIKNRFD